MRTEEPFLEREQCEAELAQRASSVGEMLAKRATATPDRIAFSHPVTDGVWADLSWARTQQLAHEYAAAILSLGIQREERVALAASTRIEWVLADLGISCAGAATTTVYPSTQHDDVAYILSDSNSRLAIVENTTQLEKLLAHPEVFDALVAVVLIDGTSDHDKVLSWAEFGERGRAHLTEHPDCVRDAIAATGPDSLATLIYTSGTTGRPKGVRLPHDVWAYEGRAMELFGLIDENDVHYLWLPLSHVFGKCLIAVQLQLGFRTAVDGRVNRIVEGLAEVKPTIMAGAPRIFEKVRAAVMMTAPGGTKAQIARWAFAVGKRSIPYRLEGRPMPRALAMQYAAADRLVFSKLKAKLGGNLRFLISGSAKLNKQVQDWFYAAGILLFEGYGMTETSAITFLDDPRRPNLGTVGPPMPGISCRLDTDGEVLVKGPCVASGYHNLPEVEAEAFTDGWFHTGDIGEIDERGCLRITDRKKDLMKTSGGKYVAPQKVEGAIIANCPYVSQVVAYGEGRKYISALIALDPGPMRGWAENHDKGKLADLSDEELRAHPETREMLQRYIDKANTRLERWETVKRFEILPAELNVDDGTATPSLKIRRAQVIEKYGDLVEKLYDVEA